mgnify:CR=1 FL=1
MMKKEIDLGHHLRVVTENSPGEHDYGRRNNDEDDFVLKILHPEPYVLHALMLHLTLRLLSFVYFDIYGSLFSEPFLLDQTTY